MALRSILTGPGRLPQEYELELDIKEGAPGSDAEADAAEPMDAE